MSNASGTRVQITYIEETVAGETPSSPDTSVLRATQRVINPVKALLATEEVRQDRQIAESRHGFQSVEGTVGFELSLAAYNDMLEGALAGTWAGVTLASLGTLSITAATNTLSRSSGSWVTDGVTKGMTLRLTSFSDGSNNRDVTVQSVSASDIVVVEDLTADDSGGTAVVQGNVLKMGTDLKTYTFERSFLDVDQHQAFRGCAINTMSLRLQPSSIVGGDFGIVGMSFGEMSSSRVDESPTAAPANSPFDAFTGALYEGTTMATLGVLTGMTLDVNNNRSVEPVLFQDTSLQVFEGQGRVSGTITAYFANAALYNKFVNETESSLFVRMVDEDGTGFITIFLPRVKINSSSMNPPQLGPVLQEIEFEALVDSTLDTTMLMQRSDS